jgi:cobalt-zinc-cadmium efflux system membrane fusion protein
LQVVEEPHSFDVRIAADHAGRRFAWAYSSVEGKVSLSDAVLASTGIEVWTIGPRDITTTVERAGQVVADDTRVAHVVSILAGTIASIGPKAGDRVRQGDVLAVVHSRELADLRSAYLLATHHTEFARAAATREEALWKKKISAEKEYLAARRDAEEAELAERTAQQKLIALGDSPAFLAALRSAPATALPRHEVRAPIDGIVLERDATIGEAVTAAAAIFLIGDLSTVLVEVSVDAPDLVTLRLGQSARIAVAGGFQETTARISYLSPRIDPTTRRGTARVALANADGRWPPGLFVTVHFVEATATVAMAVPVGAIQTFRDWQVVFFRFGDWFEARPLELGRSDGRWIEVVSGLAPGDRYAATNSFAIKAEIGKLGATHDH